ncbi:MAG: branched-chain amino acid ABC transporter permease, partial [Fimbriimonadaceae bacterium]|nr:branched-chain amino acid ABC transporter permease [Alphaproteobacteria bacterium]
MTTRMYTMLALVMVLSGLVLVPVFGSRYVIDLTTEIMIYALFALSLNLLLGYAGNISFGHAAFFAIGGYACLVLTTTYGWPLILAFPAAILATGFAALIIGYFCVKLNEIYFAMLTLAFSMLVWSIAFKWRDVTGGDDGFVGAIVPEFIGTRPRFFYFSLIIVSVATYILWKVCHSTFGRGLVAIRENPARAKFIGMDIRRMRLIAFVISGAFAGVAGALFGLYNRGMYPESSFWTESAQVLIMTLLGGIYS